MARTCNSEAGRAAGDGIEPCRPDSPGLAESIDRLLPQTQCTRCGYPACRDYARALAAGRAELNRCPPGGVRTVAAIARLLEREPRPLDLSCGAPDLWRVARIEEHACIGCTLCLRACPVDAILGAAGHMHTVIEAQCTGCELCVPVCPVDCIRLAPMPWPGVDDDLQVWWMRERATGARQRFEARSERVARLDEQRQLRRQARRARREQRRAGRAAKLEVIRAAVARARARRGGSRGM